jgi:hypothetical protein
MLMANNIHDDPVLSCLLAPRRVQALVIVAVAPQRRAIPVRYGYSGDADRQAPGRSGIPQLTCVAGAGASACAAEPGAIS